MEGIWDLVVVLAVILFSMTLHEMMHGFVAYRLGDHTPKADGRLSFNPLKHLDPWMSVILPMMLAISGGPIFGGAKPVRINTNKLKWGEWGFALVAIAGPLTNLLLAFISFQLLYYINPAGPAADILLQMVLVNLGFCVFNLIPIPPLDGSRVLRALAPEPVQRFMDKIEHYDLLVILILIIFGGTLLSSLMAGAMQGILIGFQHLVF